MPKPRPVSSSMQLSAWRRPALDKDFPGTARGARECVWGVGFGVWGLRGLRVQGLGWGFVWLLRPISKCPRSGFLFEIPLQFGPEQLGGVVQIS